MATQTALEQSLSHHCWEKTGLNMPKKHFSNMRSILITKPFEKHSLTPSNPGSVHSWNCILNQTCKNDTSKFSIETSLAKRVLAMKDE